MMAALTARAAALAERAAARARGRVAAAIAAVPGVTAKLAGDGVVATGRRLKARWIDDARLRWLDARW